MPNIPLSAYDIFAYLTAGFVLIGAADFAFPGKWILDAELSVIQGFVWIVLAYVLGHVISAVAAPLIEDIFVERRLGYREDVLLGAEHKRFGPLFKGYFKPLPERIQQLVLARAEKEARIGRDRKALFLYGDAKVRQKPEASPTLATFLNVYGFARNACLPPSSPRRCSSSVRYSTTRTGKRRRGLPVQRS